MNIVKLTESFAVSAQISEADVAAIAAAGYKVLINNRPDGEESSQPSSAAIAAAARAAGLEYHHLPVTALNFPGAGFEEMCDLLDDVDRPVLAFCRSGTRCTNLWIAGCEGSERQQAISLARQRGFDIGMAERFSSR
jgi:uncharacterized protein (TIGR01244 family)